MKLLTLSLVLLGSAIAEPTVYLIRHGEKPTDDGAGLSPTGEQRALCLTSVFGPDSGYNIDYILAESYDSDGSHDRPYLTVLPLADELGLTIDDSCSKKDQDCVADLVENYTGSGNILICWEHKQLNNIVEALGVDDQDNYPDDDYGLIWTLPYPWTEITSTTDENCSGLEQ